jgi:TolA-binding protein
MRALKHTLLLAVLTFFFACAAVSAQTAPSPVPAQKDATPSPTNLIDATNQYKDSSEQLLTIQKDTITKAEAKLEELRTLVSEGLVAKAEFEDAEQKLAALRVQLQATQKRITDSDNMIAEIKAEQELAKTAAAKPVKLVSKQYGAFSTTATMLRYNGLTAWRLGGLDEIQAFFSTQFGRLLPTSAVGQSATHNRLGYDHRNAVDVALHPDSSEGRALINYLQRQGIPFLAFRGAIPGVATGPHIHIGSPSHRLS